MARSLFLVVALALAGLAAAGCPFGFDAPGKWRVHHGGWGGVKDADRGAGRVAVSLARF